MTNQLFAAASPEAKRAYLRRFSNFFLSAKGMQLKTNFVFELNRLLSVYSEEEQEGVLGCLDDMAKTTYKGVKA